MQGKTKEIEDCRTWSQKFRFAAVFIIVDF